MKLAEYRALRRQTELSEFDALKPVFWRDVSKPHGLGEVQTINACWYWTGPEEENGRPAEIRYRSYAMAVYRYAYLAGGKELAPGQRVHGCIRHKLCVNPGHMSLVSEGTRKAKLRDRRICVDAARPIPWLTMAELSARHGVSKNQIHRILKVNGVVRPPAPPKIPRLPTEAERCRDRNLVFDATRTDTYHTNAELARHYGVSPKYVAELLKKHNVAERPQPYLSTVYIRDLRAKRL